MWPDRQHVCSKPMGVGTGARDKGPVVALGQPAWPVWEEEEGNEQWGGVLVIHNYLTNHRKTKGLTVTVPLSVDSAMGQTRLGSAGQVSARLLVGAGWWQASVPPPVPRP